jgi:hypothetical protein
MPVVIDHTPETNVTVARANPIVDQRITLLGRKRTQLLTHLLRGLTIGEGGFFMSRLRNGFIRNSLLSSTQDSPPSVVTTSSGLTSAPGRAQDARVRMHKQVTRALSPRAAAPTAGSDHRSSAII